MCTRFDTRAAMPAALRRVRSSWFLVGIGELLTFAFGTSTVALGMIVFVTMTAAAQGGGVSSIVQATANDLSRVIDLG